MSAAEWKPWGRGVSGASEALSSGEGELGPGVGCVYWVGSGEPEDLPQ